MKRKAFIAAIALTGVFTHSQLRAEESATKRLADSAIVLRETSRASDKGVPRDLLEKARCVVVVPGLKKAAFIGGGKFGKGFASCITSKGWSAPAAIRVEGGSFGLQIGVSSTDVIMLVMNQGGMTKLTSDKFTLGGEAGAAAGPVGRNTSANTDVLMKAEILSYSRSRGLFAGLSLEGATLRPDVETDRELYGADATNLGILTGEVKRPVAAAAFLAQVERFSGKGTPPVRPHRMKPAATNTDAAVASAMPGAGSSATGVKPDNTKMNQGAQSGSALTADNSKNGHSDLDVTRRIRRSIIADKTLSTNGHNVKIIVQHGAVTLKGPVHSDAEKASIEAKAVAVAGAGNVTNQIEIVPAK